MKPKFGWRRGYMQSDACEGSTTIVVFNIWIVLPWILASLYYTYICDNILLRVGYHNRHHIFPYLYCSECRQYEAASYLDRNIICIRPNSSLLKDPNRSLRLPCLQLHPHRLSMCPGVRATIIVATQKWQPWRLQKLPFFRKSRLLVV